MARQPDGRGSGIEGSDGELDTIDLSRPLDAHEPPSVVRGSVPLLPGRPPSRPASHRPHRIPPPPLTDVDFYRWVFAPFEACVTKAAVWAGTQPVGPPGGGRVLPGWAQGRDGVRLTVLLPRRWWRSAVAMELVLRPGTAPFGTQLTLRPLSPVRRPGRRYFRAGHAVLNSLESAVEDGVTDARGGPAAVAAVGGYSGLASRSPG